MMSEAKEYKECYVAFVDVLGFKNIIQNGNCDEIYSIFEDLFVTEQIELAFNDKKISIINQVKYMIMSDSIVMYIDSSLDDSLFALLYRCLYLQQQLLERKIPILLRGGISKGELFVDEEKNIIFGKALTKAYFLENGIAKYPRIVFNRELLDTAIQHNTTFAVKDWENLIISKDEDELFFVGYVGFFLAVDKKNELLTCLDNVLTYCQEQLDTLYDQSVREKYLWLKRTIIHSVDINFYRLRKYCANLNDFCLKWGIKA